MPEFFIRSVFLVVMPLLAVAAPAAQLDDQPAVVSLFEQAEQRLQNKDWQGAQQILDQLLAQFPDSPNRDLFLYSHGKACYYGGENASAQADFDGLLSQFPSSDLAPYAVYFWANAALGLGNVDKAVPEYVRSYAISQDPRLHSLISDVLAALDGAATRSLLTHDGLGRLNDQQRCALVHAVAEKMLALRRIDDAAYVQSLCPDKNRAPAPADSLGEVIRVGVVVPLSGEYQQYGQEILNGAMVAAQQGPNGVRRIVLSPFDTQGDAISAGRIVGELARLKYDAVIGPLTSEEASVAAAAASGFDMPLLIPAATGAGLTLLGENAFQLAPNIELQGVLMAEYAVRNLRADTAVVITPTTVDYGQIAQAFVSRFEALGGKVIGVEYYRSSDRDFGDCIQSIKSVIQRRVEDSAVYLGARGDTLDARSVPAQVDCIFMPGPSDQLRQLISQLRFYNLSGAYLGNDAWGNDQVCSLGDDLCRGALFASPFLQKGVEQREFIKAYMAQHGDGPTRLACLGYDAVGMLWRGLAENPTSRRDWITRMAQTHNYDGAAGRISLGQYRENIELPVYKIESGHPVLVGLSQGATTNQSEP